MDFARNSPKRLEGKEKQNAENEQPEKKAPGWPKLKKRANSSNMIIEQMFNYDNNL